MHSFSFWRIWLLSKTTKHIWMVHQTVSVRQSLKHRKLSIVIPLLGPCNLLTDSIHDTASPLSFCQAVVPKERFFISFCFLPLLSRDITILFCTPMQCHVCSQPIFIRVSKFLCFRNRLDRWLPEVKQECRAAVTKCAECRKSPCSTPFGSQVLQMNCLSTERSTSEDFRHLLVASAELHHSRNPSWTLAVCLTPPATPSYLQFVPLHLWN